MRGEFLKRRRLGHWESVAGDCKQKAQARLPVSGTPLGSIQRSFDEVIVIRSLSGIF
jgi:hypothetical protein